MSQKLADRLYSVLPSATRGSPLYPSHSPQKGASKRESNTDRESAAFTLPKGIRFVQLFYYLIFFVVHVIGYLIL